MTNTPLILATDNPAELDSLTAELTSHFDPDDLSTRRAVREMIHAEWHLRRARRQLATLTAAGIMPVEEVLTTSAAARLEARAQQNYDRANRQWTALQNARRAAVRSH